MASVAVALAVVEWSLRVYGESVQNSESMDEGFVLFDRYLGWRLNPGWKGNHRHFDFEAYYTVNELGFRGESESIASDNKVFFLGDSFTFGLGVNDNDTFVHLLNNSADRENLSFFNLGVPGYAPDQQLILLDNLLNYDPDTLLWVIYIGNDLLDIRYPFALQADYGKPYFELNNGRLALKNSPVPLRMKNDGHHSLSVSAAILGNYDLYSGWRDFINQFQIGIRLNSMLGIDESALRSYLEKSQNTDFRLFMAMAERARGMLNRQGSKLAFVLMPGSAYFKQNTVPGIYQRTTTDHLANSLRAHEFKVMDLSPNLSKLMHSSDQPLYYPNDGHLTPYGHRKVAEILSQSNLW
jgi:hypothetical protein